MRILRLGLLLAPMLWLMATETRAQQPPALTIDQVDATAYPEIRAVVTAVDASGRPAASLSVADFSAFEQAEGIEVAAVQVEQLPLSVVLTLDVSASMEGQPLALAKQAATEFVRKLGQQDEAAVVTFSGTVLTAQGFTPDKALLEAVIAPLEVAPATALFEAVQASALVGAGGPAARKAVVLLSDGQNDANLSTATREGSLSAARDAGVPFFTVGFGDAPDEAYLQAVADVSRGQYRPATAASIATVYDDISALLRNQYQVTLRARGEPDGADSELRLVASIGGVPAEATAAFKRGVGLPAPTPAPLPVTTEDGGGLPWLWVLLAGAALVAVVGGFGGGRRLAQAMNQRARERGAGSKSGEDVPLPEGTVLGEATQVEARGRIVALDGTGAAFEFGELPLTIGSGPRCAVRLDVADDVAGEHARVWMRNGSITLRHIGGARRKTFVGDSRRPVDWVILDPGDEFAIGRHRYRAERL